MQMLVIIVWIITIMLHAAPAENPSPTEMVVALIWAGPEAILFLTRD